MRLRSRDGMKGPIVMLFFLPGRSQCERGWNRCGAGRSRWAVLNFFSSFSFIHVFPFRSQLLVFLDFVKKGKEEEKIRHRGTVLYVCMQYAC